MIHWNASHFFERKLTANETAQSDSARRGYRRGKYHPRRVRRHDDGVHGGLRHADPLHHPSFQRVQKKRENPFALCCGHADRHRGAGQPAEISLCQLSSAHLHDLHWPHPGRTQSAAGQNPAQEAGRRFHRGVRSVLCGHHRHGAYRGCFQSRHPHGGCGPDGHFAGDGRGRGRHHDHSRRVGQHGADAAGLLQPRAQRRGRLENRRIQHGLCRHGRPRF